MRSLKAGFGALLCSSAIVQPAFAQDEGESDDNVIIVTATQRASDVQDIPIAVTAVTPTQLDQQGIQDVQSLASVSSSFRLNTANTESQGTTIRIRGIGTTGNNIGLESAVGVFIDGVYQSRPGVALGDLVDLEQLEVLRGPQGTLFGRNTTAGALNIKTARPDLSDFEGFVNASYGNFNAISLQGGVSAPLVQDQLGVRLSGAYRKRDGFVESLPGLPDTSDRDRWLVRGQLLWEPTSDISLRIIGDYQQTDERCCDGVVLSPPTSPAIAPLLPALLPLGTAGFAGAGGRVTADELIGQSNTPLENNVEQWGVSAEFKWDFGVAELTYIGAYRDFFADADTDDFQALDVFTSTLDDDIKTWTHELRLQGTAFNDVLDWLVGVYYADEQIVENISLTLGSDFRNVVGLATFGAPGLLELVSAGGNFLAGGGVNPANFVETPATGLSAPNRFSQDGESFSVFTHNIFNITDSFSVTLGARYVDDTKNGSLVQGPANNPNACFSGLTLRDELLANPAGTAAAFAPFGPVVQGTLTNADVVGGGAFLNCFPFAAPTVDGTPLAAFPFLPQQFDTTFEDDEFIYTIQAGWEPNDDILAYASFTHGYKAGGVNLDVTGGAGGADPRFRSEEIDTYEVGLKTTFWDGRARVNVALFHNELSDFQVLEFTGVNFQTFNVDDVTSTGFEVESSFKFSDYISGGLNVTYADAKYGDNCDATFVAAGGFNPAVNLCGTDLTNAPEWSGNASLTYDGPIDDSGWNLLTNLNLAYESSRRTRTIAATGPFGLQKANLKVNARIGVTTPDERFTAELWGLNLTNEITRGATFNTPLLGDSVGAFGFSDPRTYGVTLRGKF